MVGQAFMREGNERGWDMAGAARRNADVALDITDCGALARCVAKTCPELIINAAALVELDKCEADPGLAYMINARPVALLTRTARPKKWRLLHISTDHFFSGDGATLHKEGCSVTLVNEYARSKFAAEQFALLDGTALVIRTNVTGFRSWKDKPTFAEWAIEGIEKGTEMSLFEDYYSSTLDAGTLAKTALDMVTRGASGLFNVASRQVASKKQFVEALARQLGKPLASAKSASVQSLSPPRAESLGLAVDKAERFLGHSLPDLDEVVARLINEYRRRSCNTTAS
jgi:dTDP-4-dehydrorhamnose reductase